MSSLADFSLNNALIKAYFQGSDEYIPSSELWYIHSHPLVRPNFVEDIEVLINKASQVIEAKNMRGRIVEDFVDLGQKLGRLLPLKSEKEAEQALVVLRRIHKQCVAITGKKG